MSMHRKPLTRIEEHGLRLHGLAIGTPSQLSDCFRQGVAWAMKRTSGMPQASSETLKAWPHGDEKAMQLLKMNFSCKHGVFELKDSTYSPSEDELAAIQYMVEEWDYGYRPKG